MQNEPVAGPEIKLLNSIIDEELKNEENEKLKDAITRKAILLYQLSSLAGTRGLDDDEIKKKIKTLIEEE